jgi:hypothetical protein
MCGVIRLLGGLVGRMGPMRAVNGYTFDTLAVGSAAGRLHPRPVAPRVPLGEALDIVRGDDSAETTAVHDQYRHSAARTEALQDSGQQLVRCGECAPGQRHRQISHPRLLLPPVGLGGQSAQLHDTAGATLEVQ